MAKVSKPDALRVLLALNLDQIDGESLAASAHGRTIGTFVAMTICTAFGVGAAAMAAVGLFAMIRGKYPQETIWHVAMILIGGFVLLLMLREIIRMGRAARRSLTVTFREGDLEISETIGRETNIARGRKHDVTAVNPYGDDLGHGVYMWYVAVGTKLSGFETILFHVPSHEEEEAKRLAAWLRRMFDIKLPDVKPRYSQS